MGSYADLLAAVQADLGGLDLSAVSAGWVGPFGPGSWPMALSSFTLAEDSPQPSGTPGTAPTMWVQWGIGPGEPLTNVATGQPSQQAAPLEILLVYEWGAPVSIEGAAVDAIGAALVAGTARYHLQGWQVGRTEVLFPWNYKPINIPGFSP